MLVSTPSPLVQQVLVVQAQNGVNMASGTATTAPSTATAAPSPSTAPLPLAGPITMEPIVPIGVQLGAQDTPSVIQGARPVVSIEQTMQSTQRYGTLPYVSGPPYTAPLPSKAPLPYAAYTVPLPSTAHLPYAAMPATSARPTLPMGYWDDVEINTGRSASAKRARPEDQITDKAKAKRARSASTSRRSPSPKRDYPRGLAQPLGHLRPVPKG